MKLSTKLFAAFVVVSFIFTAVSIINFRMSRDVLENSQWVQKSQVVIRNSLAVQRNIIDMESGMRGFLLTGNEAFLEPYGAAARQVPVMFSEQETLISDSPAQLKYLKQIQAIHHKWLKDFAEVLIDQKRRSRVDPTTGLDALPNADRLMNLEGRQMMLEMRRQFRAFNAIEYDIRKRRAERLEDSINYTSRLSAILTVLSVILGLICAYYISRIISRRIMLMVNHAEHISHGNYKTTITDDSNDELSSLSVSLNKMAYTIDRNVTELEIRNKELDQFAYVVSHDLKAPLRGIQNVIKWIEEDLSTEISAHLREYLDMMRSRINRMESLINGILALARIGRGQEVRERVDVKELLNEIIDLLAIPARFTITIPDQMPVLHTVPVQLHQVFSNLISNAVKYHDKPSGEITIRSVEEEQYYRFSVTDNGPGIDPEYHERIFVVFQTLTERDALESTGVGLAIVKKIIDRRGGRITVDSEPGKGTTFTFTWPKS